MALPYFFVPFLESNRITLDEDTSRHVCGVLRMQKGEELLLTDGKGKKAKARIVEDNRKKTVVENISLETQPPAKRKITIGISLVKNASRFEWFLEKATEIGVYEIIPMICERTEKEKFRMDRQRSILISAMVQSQQCFMPLLSEPVNYSTVVNGSYEGQKLIAHCNEMDKSAIVDARCHDTSLILIGPEGDFTPREIEMALSRNFIPVTLGSTRLRTETAGLVAATILCIT